MSEAPPAGISLEEAFRRFEAAAGNLQDQHSSLLAKAERLERQLLDANRRLETVLDALDSGVAVVSDDGGLLRTNDSFERLGLTGEDGQLSSSVLSHLVRSSAQAGGTARLRHASPRGPRDLAATLIPVGDEEGTRVLTVQDITEIRREAAEGGRRQRLEALGRMAAELAHEVRNPLGSIRLFACMLEDDLKQEEGKRVMVEQILAATAGLESTVSNLLAFASPPGGEFRDVDVAGLAREACSLLAPACSVRGVSLEGPSADESCVVTSDREALRQVVLNLLGNSLAATESGGSIRITTRRNGATMGLTVTDDGCGIAAEDLPRVFDPFFTRTEGGTGLGLSIVHGIVERHAGRISMDSRPGCGTRVHVDLPCRDRSVAGDEAAHG